MINQRQSTYPSREPVQTNRATSLGVALMGSVLDGVADTALSYALRGAITLAIAALLGAAMAATFARSTGQVSSKSLAGDDRQRYHNLFAVTATLARFPKS
ncbi:hypothetical protein [Sphingomonas sp. CROZ-RG-20F-R02-07]|uniref:hypothetical protein n=1 Tax=Sphingomonas sp. CROZ-RG-20F-R02-07 TaxID=2914832 RepID=UPI001F59C383|nr:hypothetical protein [Sphingomonas sp. CROZ-RG-20F-R02-07]